MGPVFKSLSSHVGSMSSIHGWGTRIPHAVGQLSLCPTTTEKPAHCDSRSPGPATKACVVKQKVSQDTTRSLMPQLRPNAAKEIRIFKC